MSYPFVKCLNPRHIVNPYTGQSMIVQCGKCPTCLLHKSSINTMKCELESMSHKYTMFVTLTYDNQHLPKMRAVADNMRMDECGEIYDSGELFKLIDDTPRLGKEGTFLGYCENFHLFSKLQSKVELPLLSFPRLSKYDAQLFLKRLRRNIDRKYQSIQKTNIFYGLPEIFKAPKIRYYLVGEYGPRHFRPHYHLLLWFSEDSLYTSIRQIICESWQFGRVDCQKSQGKCSQYVAKYVNCNMSLPEIFGFQQTRPFAIHSTHLGEKILEKTREEIYTSDYQRIVSRCIPSINSSTDVILWRSLKINYFPKCKGFAQKSKYECLYSYKVYEYASNWLGKTSVAELSRTIMEYCIGVVTKHSSYLRRDTKLIDYFIKSCGIDLYLVLDNFTDWELYLRAIYMELRLSKHFIHFCCNNNPNNYCTMYDKIVQFWKDDDMYNINNLYESIEDFINTPMFTSPNDIDFVYVNKIFDVEQFKQTTFFRQFRQEQLQKADNSVKHKKLNDANRIFNY